MNLKRRVFPTEAVTSLYAVTGYDTVHSSNPSVVLIGMIFMYAGTVPVVVDCVAVVIVVVDGGAVAGGVVWVVVVDVVVAVVAVMVVDVVAGQPPSPGTQLVAPTHALPSLFVGTNTL